MAATLKYPIGIQSFSSLIEGGYTYVDKTMYIHSLLNNGKYFFLSRPRRFGKSLFLSTLEAYFKGERELFKGLAIEKHESEWKPRPVIKLSFSSIDALNEDSLHQMLDNTLLFYEKNIWQRTRNRRLGPAIYQPGHKRKNADKCQGCDSYR